MINQDKKIHLHSNENTELVKCPREFEILEFDLQISWDKSKTDQIPLCQLFF
jgi:hypothetical protein